MTLTDLHVFTPLVEPARIDQKPAVLAKVDLCLIEPAHQIKFTFKGLRLREVDVLKAAQLQ